MQVGEKLLLPLPFLLEPLMSSDKNAIGDENTQKDDPEYHRFKQRGERGHLILHADVHRGHPIIKR